MSRSTPLRLNSYSALRWGLMFLTCLSFTRIAMQDKRPTFFIIGDSTVKNGSGKGGGGLWGWGNFIEDYFDTSKVSVTNRAIGGRSSKSYISEGRWDQVMSELKPGDFVIMQWGHNDGGPLDDTARARGSIRGTGEETKDIYNPVLKKSETVHTYGWYLRKYVSDCQSKGVTAVICSPIPRNIFVDGKCTRSTDYGKWAEETAHSTGVAFIDLNAIIADQYDLLGPDKVKEFFPGDHTHTNEAGARLNAKSVITGLRKIPNLPLNNYLLPAAN